MWKWATAGAATALAASAVVLGRHQANRRRLHRQLASTRAAAIAGREPTLRPDFGAASLPAEFAQQFIVRIDDFLTPATHARIREEALAAGPLKKRSYIPTHKKGGTVSYEEIHRSCPNALAFYHSAAVRDFVSKVVGMPVGSAGDHDQSAESILYYEEEGDHIHWHFDHNFYRGRQFTALLSLVNQSVQGDASAATLVCKDKAGIEHEVDTRAGTFVIFEGAKVLHRATPAAAGDLRVLLSMTFNTDPRISFLGEASRRAKDTAFFGLRALFG
ncbi:MAG: 2OG-Fe(II) oxygenase [Gemmataceae bacterium]|nr:2OG-Fe(II) oxygenase [Gemmataceae bacterium]